MRAPSFVFDTSRVPSAGGGGAVGFKLPPPPKDEFFSRKSSASSTSINCGFKQRSYAEIDQDYKLIGCIHHGAFGDRILLATNNKSHSTKKKRFYTIKHIMMDTDNDEMMEAFTKEIQAISKLNTCKKSNMYKGRFLHIEEYFVGPGYACIVSRILCHGRLADEIDRKKKAVPFEPYTERRIAWYALQLSEALAHAHTSGVAHGDVNSSNVFIADDGRLLLGHFDSFTSTEETQLVRFNKTYAPPEPLERRPKNNEMDMSTRKVDAFGLGCILFELLSCCRLEELSTNGETLAKYIITNSTQAALNLPCIMLPWLPEPPFAFSTGYIGYSHALKSLVTHLIQPNVEKRWLPSILSSFLRHNHQSPLLSASLVAAQSLTPGAAVTVDNVQLGMFVQRGINWEHGDSDGGKGTIGVIVRLDADADYTTWAAFPTSIKPIRFRIGAEQKYDLQVGPPLRHDALPSRWNGIAWRTWKTKFTKYAVGSQFHTTQMIIVASEDDKILVAPTERVTVPMLPLPPSIVRSHIEPSCMGQPADPSSAMPSITSFLAGYSLAAAPVKATDGEKSKKAGASSPHKSATKECVVCMERPVRRIVLPCGHCCLCNECSEDAILRKLKRKCPECRQDISQTAVIYGRVVDD